MGALSNKMNVPILHFLCDMYQRERVKKFHENESGIYQILDWVQNNKFFKELKQFKKKYDDKITVDVVKVAMDSFFHRIIPKLGFKSNKLFVDSLAEISQYIASIVQFVAKLCSSKFKETTCPFQFDAVLAFPLLKTPPGEDDDFDAYDDDNYYEMNIFDDICGNEGLLSYKVENDKTSNKLRIMPGFEKFVSEQISTKYKGKDLEQYPRKHRFCLFIGRKSLIEKTVKNAKDKPVLKKDELIFFEPPKDCNTFPKGQHQPLFYFDTSRTCIVPNMVYPKKKNQSTDDNDDDDDDDQKEVQQNGYTMTSVSKKGGTMTFSFHVESVDVIRCYFYVNGQCIRFMPEDIKLLLPLFFDEKYGKNAEFANSKEAETLINEMKDLKDDKFKAFMKQYQ